MNLTLSDTLKTGFLATRPIYFFFLKTCTFICIFIELGVAVWQSRLLLPALFICIFVELGVAVWQSRLTKLELFICIFVELGVAVWQSRLTKLDTFYLYIFRTGCSCVAIKTYKT